MAEQLKNYQPTTKGGPASIYPWEDWLKPGTKWKITQGTDFNCTRISMDVQIRRKALSLGLKTSVFKEGKKCLVIVNAVKNTKTSPKRPK